MEAEGKLYLTDETGRRIFGPGPAELLEQVERTGSLRAAARTGTARALRPFCRGPGPPGGELHRVVPVAAIPIGCALGVLVIVELRPAAAAHFERRAARPGAVGASCLPRRAGGLSGPPAFFCGHTAPPPFKFLSWMHMSSS